MDFQNKIPFAIKTETGAIVSVDDVERGLAAGCHCPSCKGLLVARKGEQNRHCFAHYRDSKEKCFYAFETSVRLMLLSKLESVVKLNTPAHYTSFDGVKELVAKAHADIGVQFVPQAETHGVPAGLFQLMSRPDFHLALHFPAAHEPVGLYPLWLGRFIAKHPKTGVLAVRYSQFGDRMFDKSRPAGMDTTTLMLTILSENPNCLHWLYHPREEMALIALEQLAEQRRQEAEEKARQQQLKQEQLEKARRQYEAKQRMQREHQAAITAQMRLAEQERAAQRARDYAARAAQDSDKTSNGGQYPRSTPTACRNCQLQHQRLDADGYCYREVCIRSRAKRIARAEKAEASTRYSYASMRGGANVNRTPQKQTNPVASPQPVSDTQRQWYSSIKPGSCPHCGGDRGNGPNGWWCEKCK